MPLSQQSWWRSREPVHASRRRTRRRPRSRAGRCRRRVPRVRRHAQGPAHHVHAPVRETRHARVPRAEDAGLPALPRPPQAAQVPGHRPGEVCGLLAVRGRLPGRVHPRGRGREHGRPPGLRRRALRRGLRDQHEPLHLLRLLRGRVPVRRDHDAAGLRALRLRADRPDLHQGDAPAGPAGAHPAEEARRVGMDVLQAICFFVAGIFALGGAVGVVMLRNPFFSVLALVMHLLALAALFLLLHAQFLAASQIIVYAGAVMVLYVFVAAYVGGVDEPMSPSGPLVSLAPLFAAALFVELVIAALGSGLSAINTEGATVSAGFGGPAQFGELLLKRFLIPFEAASYLLLIAAVGAVVLARRRRGIEHLDDEEEELAPPRAEAGPSMVAPGAQG